MKRIIKIIEKILSFRNSTVKKNFIALSVLKITNYIFPLITLPYISRIFGPDIYGLLNFANSFILYFWLLVNYGFDLSASREIAHNRNDRKKIVEIFNAVLFTKLFLYCISTLIFLIVLLNVDKISSYKKLYLIIYFGGIFKIFFPTWYFQGIEKLTFTAIFTFIIRLIFTILIFVLIKSKNDYLLYPVTMIIGQILVSFLSMVIIIKKYKISIYLPSVKEIKLTLKNGWRVFATTIVINLYTRTNLIILGFLASNHEVGIYASAQKIVLVIMSIISGPISQSLYPNIGYSFSISYEKGMRKIFKAIKFIIPLTLIPSLITYLFAKHFIYILFGEKFIEAISPLKILAFLPFIIGLSNIFGIQGLLNLKMDNYVYRITAIGAIVGITLNLILVPIFNYNGTALSWLITEIVITLFMAIVFIKRTNFLTYVNCS